MSLCTVIHREMLATQKMSPELIVLHDVMITTPTLKYAPFTPVCPCGSMSRGTQSTRVFSHTRVRWLSTGRSLARVSELREPLQRSLLEKQSPLVVAHFSGRSQNLLACVTCSACLTKRSCHLRGERRLCSRGHMKWLIQSRPRITGATREHWDF